MNTRNRAQVEKLEPRTLLSAWSTVDSFQLVAGQRAGANAMTADRAGNVYAAGTASGHGIVREKSSGSRSWTTIEDLPAASFFGMAVDAAGDVFVSGGNNTGYGIVLERVTGQATFSQVDSFIGSAGYGTLSAGVAADAAGNVYAAGYTLERVSTGKHSSTNEYYEVVRERASGASVFSTVDHFSENGNGYTWSSGVTVIGSGTSAGVYVVGHYNNTNDHWLVRKSSDSGKTWSTVDDFMYDTSNDGGASASAVAGDPFGNIYVVGTAAEGLTSSGTRNDHWIVRKSNNGGISWSINDDYQLSPSYSLDYANAVGTDLAGNVYVVGQASDANGNHSIVRSNAGGSWATVDNFQGSAGYALGAGFTVDANGNLYACGRSSYGSGNLYWFVRSLPAAPTSLTATADPILPSSQINLSWTNTASGDETGFAICRSTDGINFTAVATAGSSATSYNDGGLLAGTTYFYYVVALLKATGASAGSNTASASTST